MRVAICIPAYGDTKALFTQSLGTMLIFTLSQEITVNGAQARPQLIQIMSPGLARVDWAREQLAAEALDQDPDYLLWLDTDHTFPRDTLLRLMTHDLPFVGCNFRKRFGPGYSAATRVDGKLVRLEPKGEGVEPVDQLGFGVSLIKAGVFKSLPRPWFVMGPEGEDGYFCERAIGIGARPHVDHALSRESGHIAERVLEL